MDYVFNRYEMKVNIVTLRGYFGHKLNVEESLDINILVQSLSKYGIDVRVCEIEELLNVKINENEFYLVTSHQNPDVKKYLNDVVFSKFIYHPHNVIPRLDLYFAHDNKGIQSIIMDHGKNIKLIHQEYILDGLDLDFEGRRVFKPINGAGGKGVKLLTSYGLKKEVKSLRNANCTIYEIKTKIKEFIKSIVKGNKYNQRYSRYVNKKIPFVIQEYLENLDYDYKVLVFFDKIFVLKRLVRDEDFRASGSGKFIFEEPKDSLLEYCLKVRNEINSPYVSIDVAEIGQEYYCIEYQTTHFGPYTQIAAESYYYKDEVSGIWHCLNKESSLEDEYAEAIYKYVSSKVS